MNKIETTFGPINDDVRRIREDVFIKEQGFQNEFDDIDEIAAHALLLIDSKPVATLRYFYSKEHQSYCIGRVAVRIEYRKYHLGSLLMRITETKMKNEGISKIGLSAQVRVKKFYESLGYHETDSTYLDEGCPHVWMEKDL